MVDLARIQHLYGLGLANTQVTGEGLKALATCSELKTLNLRGTAVAEDDLEALNGLPSLKHIEGFESAVAKAWLVKGTTNVGEWTTSPDGMVSLRLLVVEQNMEKDHLLVLAELRNNDSNTLRVARPFGGDSPAEGFSVIDDRSQEIPWTRPGPRIVADTGVPVADIAPGRRIRDHLWVPLKSFKGAEFPGIWRLKYTYVAAGVQDAWNGRIISYPVATFGSVK